MVSSKVRRPKTKAAKGKAARSARKGKPKYQPLPDLPPDQFEILKADIAENGLQYPVIQDEKGNTLDGHQRERALEELRIKSYPVKVIAGLTDEQKWHYALSVNVKRRNLTTAQKRALAEAELKRTPNLANNWLAEILGMDAKTVLAARKRLESTREIPKLKKLRGKDGKQRASRYRQVIANTGAELKVTRQIINELPSSCNGKMLDTTTAARRARRNVRAVARNCKVVKPSPKSSVKLFHCPFQELEKVARLRRNSVHLVLTDIPYDQKFLSQLSDLAELSKRILAPGGLFVTYTGQYYLPQVLQAFGEHLTYRWAAMSTWNVDSNMIHPLNIASKCKPILIFSNGKWIRRDRWGDVFSEDKEKRWHKHQQALGDVERLVGYFSSPRNLVVDPCAGSFSTALACRHLGRRFIGCDCDKECVRIGQERLDE